MYKEPMTNNDKAAASYAEIDSLDRAREHVRAMLAALESIGGRPVVIQSLRADAQEVWKRTEESVLEDAPARNLGASFVLRVLSEF